MVHYQQNLHWKIQILDMKFIQKQLKYLLYLYYYVNQLFLKMYNYNILKL